MFKLGSILSSLLEGSFKVHRSTQINPFRLSPFPEPKTSSPDLDLQNQKAVLPVLTSITIPASASLSTKSNSIKSQFLLATRLIETGSCSSIPDMVELNGIWPTGGSEIRSEERKKDGWGRGED